MDFTFPDVGEGLHEAKLVKWHVKEGDDVNEDDILAEVETDKAVVDIPSPHTGTIKKLHVEEGGNAVVGNIFITFETAEEKQDAQPAQKQTPKQTTRPQEQGTKRVESSLTPTPPKPEEHRPQAAAPIKNNQGTTTSPKRVLAAPSTRRLARELKIDINTITGSGPAGRVTADDVQQAAGKTLEEPAQKQEQQPVETAPATKPQATPKDSEAGWKPPTHPAKPSQQPTPPPKKPPVQKTPETPTQIPAEHYTGMRKAIGEHMVQAASAPTVTLFARTDFTALADLREHLKEWADKQGAKLTYLPLIAKAVCGALKQHPSLNAHFVNQDITYHEDVHLGIAVDTEHGLYVPVVKHADSTSVLGIAQKIAQLAESARNTQLSKEDMQGSTFTISSIGPLRVEGFTPILNSPEVGILGVGGINEEPWAVDGELRARKICTLSLTFDHRVLDGAEAARFLTTLLVLLEDPEMLILQGV